MKKIIQRSFVLIMSIAVTLTSSSGFMKTAEASTGSTTIINPRKAISVDGGRITGSLSADKSVAIYKGIPFAAPPVGDLRWKAPQPVVAWDGVKKCTEFSSSAIQAKQGPFMFWSTEFIIDTTKGYSEDCLYLNVWTKKESQVKNCPVIVYIHGGANTSGGASCDVYDGEAIAKKDVVYVSINYRVGIFGFLAHPALSGEASDKVSGNYAILDQIAALTWVKNNIAKFGGDPTNVTIAGQSAGSSNVHSLVSSPMAKGLFKNAVAMSFNTLTSNPSTLKQKEEEGAKLFEGKSLTQMRAMSADEVQALSGFTAATCIDGKVITGSTLSTYENGTANQVNMITGMVDGDSLLFPVISSGAGFFSSTKAISKEKYVAVIKEKFGDLATECLAAYPAASEDALNVFNQVNRDGSMALQYYLAKARALKSGKKTYIYNFSHYMPGPQAAEMGAFHTADVPYWLNHFSVLRDDYWAKIDYKLGDQMSSYLVNFAKTGNPNGTGLTKWNAYDGFSVAYLDLGDQISLKTLTDAQASFWKKYYGNLLGI